MIDLKTFQEIHRLRDEGCSWKEIEDQLNVTYATAKKYSKMTEEEFLRCKEVYKKPRIKKYDKYKEEIIEIIKEDPNISSAQIYKVLIKKYDDPEELSESTLRRYVRGLREEIDIPNPSNITIPKKYLKKGSDEIEDKNKKTE